MRTKVALGMSTVAIIGSFASIAYTTSTRDTLQNQRITDARKQADDAKKVAHAACLRSRKLAPPLLAHFASFAGTPYALPESVLAEYRATVPKTCD